jgi:hypothetical protein
LSANIYINATCNIKDQKICKNGSQLLKSDKTGLSEFLLEAYRHFTIDYPKFHKMDNLSKLGLLASEVLLEGSFNREKYKADEVGIVLSNANASLDTDIRFYETAKAIASPAQFVYTLPNIVIGEISIRHLFKGENVFFISEEFDTGFLEQYVSNLINNNILQCCICGWVDVLDNNYSTTLFLIEKEKSANSVNFTKDNLTKIHQLQNG